MESAWPTHVRTVVVGGGIMGCSVAYHLACAGQRDVMLLERNSLTSGTTWHAAGLLAQLRRSSSQTELARYSVSLYERLESETNQATGVVRSGTLGIARTPERWTEFRRKAGQAAIYGLEAALLSRSDVKSIWPLLNVDDVVGGLLIPTDGQGDPGGITTALAKAARALGVCIHENCGVRAIVPNGTDGWRIDTPRGPVLCESVVNCAGIWAPQIARSASVSVPMMAVEHMYIVSGPVDGLERGLPSIRDYDSSIYFKEDAGKLIMGGVEPNPKLWQTDAIPDDFAFTLLPEDWDHFSVFMDPALSRCPVLANVGIRQLLVGLEGFTADGNYLLGEVPGARGYFVGAGFNSIGIASAGGAGLALAEWITTGEPARDLSDVDIRRFHPAAGGTRFLRQRVTEVVANGFSIQWPHRHPASARNLRLSPIHSRLAGQGAVFGETMGWERPDYFAVPGQRTDGHHSFDRPHWFARVAREHRAVRETVGLFDLTSFSKFRISGTLALDQLQDLCSADLDVTTGRVVYTLMLNAHGGIACDATVTRLGRDDFLIVTGAMNHGVLAQRLTTDDTQSGTTSIVDLTSALGVLGVMGPASRALLQEMSNEDLSNPAFPFKHARWIDLGTGQCLALRICQAGELGWELYIPSELTLSVYDAITSSGQHFGITCAGMQALDSLRMECGFRRFPRDIAATDSPVEAGLEFAVDAMAKPRFRGRDAYLRRLRSAPGRRMLIFTVEDPQHTLFGKEPIYRDDRLVGATTSAAFGHTIGRPVALGYVAVESRRDGPDLAPGPYHIEIAGKRVPAFGSRTPPYDPGRHRLRS